MADTLPKLERLVVRHELLLVLVLGLAGFGSIPLWHGGMELGWDALNHHFYLGWIAEQPRFDRDFMAASSQSVQFPYLYWPVYKLAALGASGVTAGLVLAAVQATIVIPAWLLARACMPGATGFDAAMRMTAVLLALCTSAILLLVDTTSNDVLASIPLLWAMALAVAPRDPRRPAWLSDRRSVVLSGLLAGVAVACKWSNGPLAILLPGLWLLAGQSARERIGHAAAGSAATLVAFVLAYGYWGWVLWQWFGNPVYPMAEGTFAPLRQALGWHP